MGTQLMDSLIGQQGSLPSALNSMMLGEAFEQIGGDCPSSIPFFVWLIENPDSPLALPGKIYLREHDCIHLLLNRGFSLEDEAFVIGFTMGNDLRTKKIHILTYLFISVYLYPKYYRFTPKHMSSFRLGLDWGRKLQIRNINSFTFNGYCSKNISEIRLELGIALH